MSELLQAVLASLGCGFPSIIFCKAGFVATNCLNFIFILEYFVISVDSER